MTSLAETLSTSVENIRESAREATAALDEAILHDPELSHKTRMVLINLNSAMRRQSLLNETLLIVLEGLENRHDILKNYVTTTP